MHSSSRCVHLITRVFQRFSVPGERPVAKAQMFYQGELTLWFAHEPQGSDRSSCFSTLSLSNFEFIFHTLCSFLLIHVLQQYRKLASVEPCQHPMMNSSAVKCHQCTFVVPHHLSTTLTLPKRTHPVCSRKHCNPSPCLLLQHTTQDRHRLPARLKGGTQKVVRQGETRQIRWRAHLCGTQEVL